MMRKPRLVPLALSLVLFLALGAMAALAQEPGQAAAPAPGPAVASAPDQTPGAPVEQPALCAPPAPAAGLELAPFEGLGTPEPTWRPICRFRCPTTRCSSDNQCDAAPGGVCVPVCSSGCCSYP
jgi:hypothetical protein